MLFYNVAGSSRRGMGRPFQRVNTILSRNSCLSGVMFSNFVPYEMHYGLYAILRNLISSITLQGVYYYFYQLFKDEAEAIAMRRKKRGFGDGTTGMFSALIVAAISGYDTHYCS